MKSHLPTTSEFDELLSFLPRLYAPGFNPVKRWWGGEKDSKGNLVLPWPEYDKVVEEFFRVVAKECWLDTHYNPEEASRLIHNNEMIGSANLAQVRIMLTYCVRGERFSDGHWEEMIEGSYVRRLLERLRELKPSAS